MKNIIHFFCFLGLLIFSSCNENKFSPLVEVDIPPHTSRLVVRADWTAGSDSLVVFVSKSKGVLDQTKANFNQTYTYWNGKDSIKYVNEYYDTVPNTKVELLKNGQLLGTIPYFNKGYHYAKGLFQLDTLTGVTYSIRISAPGFATVEASQKVQNAFKILRGTFRADAAVYSDPFDPFSSPDKGDELTLELQDNADDENYYAIESVNQSNSRSFLIARDSSNNKTYTGTGSLRYIDPTMENDFLSDRAFNGKNYVWRFWSKPSITFYPSTGSSIRSKPKAGDRLTVRVRSVNKDFVLFLKTLDLANSATDNPFFTEPVILHTNIKSGYGIFTIRRGQTTTLILQ